MDAQRVKGNDFPAGAWFTPARFGIILGLFIFATFPKVLLGLHSFFFRDYGVLAYPFVFFHHESFWDGELPLWNPFSNCGAPYLAQWGPMVFYPLSLVYLLFPLPWSLSYFCLGHLLLGGIAMYLLAHRWVADRFAASLAGFAYVFNGVSLSCLMWPNYQVALAWMPLVVLCNERAWQQGGRWLVWGAVVTALQLLSGVPEIVLLTWLAVGALVGNELLQAAGRRWAILGRLSLVVLLAAGLAAIQLLPFFDLLAHSQRDRSFTSTKWAMPEWGFANLLVPLFHFFETPQGQFFQAGQEFLSSYYPGITILTLAIWALWNVRDRRVWVLGGLGILGLMMALGNNGLLYRWFRDLIPFVGIGRYPIKFVILTAFVVPLMAAYAIRHLQQTTTASRTRSRSLLLLACVILAVMVGILGFAKSNPFPYDQWAVTWKNAAGRAFFLIAALSLLVLQTRIPKPFQLFGPMAVILVLGWDALTHVPSSQNPTIPVQLFQPGLWQQHTGLPPPKLGESRAMIDPWAEPLLLKTSVPKAEENFLGKRLALWSNLNLLEKIPKVNGSSTLQLREQMQVQNLLYKQTNQLPRGLVDFLAVSHITASNNIVEWTMWSNSCPMITCGQKPVFEDAEKVLLALMAPDFDPRKVVYLPPEARRAVTATNPTKCQILSHRFKAHRVELEVSAEEPSLVVISQSFYHPWRASIDGQSTLLWRANYAFQALQVPAGHHQVVLAYKDRNLLWGASISAVSSLGCLTIWLRARKKSAVAS